MTLIELSIWNIVIFLVLVIAAAALSPREDADTNVGLVIGVVGVVSLMMWGAILFMELVPPR
jgi:hypothetical protein